MSNTPSTEEEAPSGVRAAEAVRDAAVSLEGMTEEQRQANKALVARNLAGLQERVAKYNAYLPRLGARAARRKAKLGPNDILMWNYIQAQHKAMDSRALMAATKKATLEGVATGEPAA